MNQKFNCECEDRKVDNLIHDYIYILCSECGGIIGRKPNICTEYKSDGYCKKAELSNYTYPCRLGGDYTKCASGIAPKEKI